MKPINSLPPFKRFCVTIGNLPSSYVDSMSYYECLMWLCKYLKDTVIPAVNENAEAVNELINWFNNLDVQDEIDNKLDEMVESGELQEIISEYLNSKAIFGYDTVADMKSATNLINGSYAKTMGFYTKNDGGSATYFIRTVTNEDDPDDMFIIPLQDVSLVAVLVEDLKYNVLQYGIKADKTIDQSEKVQYMYDKTKSLYFPAGEYKFSVKIDTRNSHIKGDGIETTRIYAPDNSTSPIDIDVPEGVNLVHSTFEGFMLDGEFTSNAGAIHVHGAGYFSLATFRNVAMYGFKYGLLSEAGIWSNYFECCAFANNTDTGLMHDQQNKAFNDNNFNSCRFISNVQKAINIYTAYGRSFANNFISCDIEQNSCDDTIHDITSTATESITLNSTSNVNFTSCYFEKNGYTNSNFTRTILLYKETGGKMCTKFDSCNITMEKAFIRTTNATETLFINCIEASPVTEKFIADSSVNLVFIGGQYTNNIYSNNTKVLDTNGTAVSGYKTSAVPINYEIPSKVAIVNFIAWGGGAYQEIKLGISGTSIKEITNTKTDSAGINYSYTYSDGVLSFTNAGSYGNIYIITQN